jgi:hypothetical protein
MIYRNGYIWYVEITDIYTTYGMFFFLFTFFFICLSQNDSMNIKYEEIIYIYSDRTDILVLETLYLS